jgi:hypothetical protein
MPRRNKPKKEQYGHVATKFDINFKPQCYGCAFAGKDFTCKSSDGQCLKIKPTAIREEADATAK